MGPLFTRPSNSPAGLIDRPHPGYNYIIAYDLNFPGRDYYRLREAIVQVSHWYASVQKSLFFINTRISSRQELYDALRAQMDANDTLCVIDFTGATLDVLKSLRDDVQSIIDTGEPTLQTRLMHSAIPLGRNA